MVESTWCGWMPSHCQKHPGGTRCVVLLERETLRLMVHAESTMNRIPARTREVAGSRPNLDSRMAPETGPASRTPPVNDPTHWSRTSLGRGSETPSQCPGTEARTEGHRRRHRQHFS